MGAGCRKSAAIASEKYHNAVDKPFYTSHQEHLKNKPDFDRLLLSNNDLNRLFDVYCKIDQDFSGEISTWELLEYLHLERTKFTKRIFRIFDEDGSGQIDFREFVIALWNYCTLGKPALIMFAFDLYDQDGSGRIDFAEVELMLKEVYGRKYDNNIQAQTIRKQIHSKYDRESISVDSFTQFVRTHPAILFPAFELQTSIQKLILGNDFWEEKANIRLKLSNGNYVSINLILKAHINNATFDELVLSNKVVNGNANRQDSLAKETIKGVLKTSGVHGERRFKNAVNNSARAISERSRGEQNRPKLDSMEMGDYDVQLTDVGAKKPMNIGSVPVGVDMKTTPTSSREKSNRRSFKSVSSGVMAANRLSKTVKTRKEGGAERKERKSVDNHSGNSPKMAAPKRRSHEFKVKKRPPPK